MITQKPYVALICFSAGIVYAKIGPFENDEKTSDWAEKFRKAAKESRVDATAIPDNVLKSFAGSVGTKDFLRSMDIQEILQRLIAKDLFGTN